MKYKYIIGFILLILFSSCNKEDSLSDKEIIMEREEKTAAEIAKSLDNVNYITIEDVDIEDSNAYMKTNWQYQEIIKIGTRQYKYKSMNITVMITNIHKKHGKLKWDSDWDNAQSVFMYNTKK